MNSIASATDEAGDEAASAGVEFGAFGEALESVDDDAMSTVVGSQKAASAIDEVGDEATESAAEVSALSGALSGFSGISSVGSITTAREALEGLSSTGGIGDELQSDLDAIPNAALKAADSTDVLRLSLDRAQENALGFTDTLNTLDEDERSAAANAIDASESVEALSLRLRRIGGGAEEAADDLGKLDESTLELIDDSLAASAGLQTFHAQVNDAGDEASKAAREIDDLGDEALQAATKTQVAGAAMDDLSASSSGLAGSLGPLRGSLSTIGPLAASIAPAIVSLTGALGGLAVAGGGAAAGIAAMAGAGLQEKAENMAAASSEFEDSSEAMESIMSDFKSALSDAFEPLKTAENAEFAMSGLEGAVELAHTAADGFAQMQDTLRPLASTFGTSVLETAPAVFDEIDVTVQQLMPTLEGLTGTIEDIPAAIAWFRAQAVALQPDLGSFAGSAISATAEIGNLGTTIMQLVLPPLTVLLDVLGWTAGLLGRLPKPLAAAAAAAAVGAAAWTAYGGAVTLASISSWSLVGAIGALTAPISGVAVAVGALVGAIVGVITYFGLWDDIISTVTGGWNALVSVVEFGIEVTYAMFQALRDLVGPLAFILNPLGAVIWTIDNLGKIIDWAGEMFQWFSGLVNDVVQSVMGWIDTAISGIQDMISWAIDAANAIPGVNIDFGDIQKSVELDAIKAGGGDEGGENPEKQESKRTKEEAQKHYDFRNADFGGASQNDIERTVKEAVRKANNESRAREDAQEF
ncbi:hypothetical protein DVR14_01085 (plasmid) [Natrinema thermotolerans]|nr:hypothetical protein DVR14_01085 [Natrinema thermotolerans]